VNQFEIPDALCFGDTPDGLERAVIATPLAEGDLYLQGAHLTHWAPHGRRPVLFVSPKTLFTPGKAIRGGVPVIFPWFGARGEGKPGPDHGFARTVEWDVEATTLRGDGAIEITLALSSNDVARGFGFSAFHLRLRVAIGATLEIDLETRNIGPEPLLFEHVLHTYFAVGDVRQATLSGLAGTTYIDKTDGFKRKSLGPDPLHLTKETDQVHLNTKAACVIHDPVWNRRILVEKSGSDSTVVWNPWAAKTQTMSDMAPESWKEMICVETANVADNAVHLYPGASHNLTVSIRVE
jgi:glucose-6-phosphate 1-epimerase